MALTAKTAAELMHTNPVSIGEDASIRDAIALLTDKGFSAAPVIDDAGRPVGVVSRSDILIHQREHVEHLHTTPEYFRKEELFTDEGESLREGFEVENVDRTTVNEIMTPAVFAVTPDTPVNRLVAQMIALRVHRLFVVDDNGVLVGVISTMDILKNLE
jgi:CBS domain-containing protein